MSTRCQVGFYRKEEQKKPDALLYFHSDGYPSGILPSLVPFLHYFNSKRGLDDIEYASAWCIAWMIKDRGYWSSDSLEDISMLSNGICKDLHGDIEYYYRVYPTKLLVQIVRGIKRQSFTTIQEIEIPKEYNENTKLKMQMMIHAVDD